MKSVLLILNLVLVWDAGAATNIPAGFRYWFGVDTPAVTPFTTSIAGPLTIQGSLKIQ